jgi:5-(carboxyamino)imidazole ribonucleotide synthase
MNQIDQANLRIGILGGGQLGRMLVQEAISWNLEIYALDPDIDAPVRNLVTNFVQGDFRDFQTVLDFGRLCNVITIEIEQVNTDALKMLKSEGIKIIPDPEMIDIIRDKGLQKQFYIDHEIETLPFSLYHNREDLINNLPELPFVQKSRTMGYDGKGVKVVRDENDLQNLLEGPCLTEPMLPFEKEIAILVAGNDKDEMVVFPVCEMMFHPEANLVEFLFCPAAIDEIMAEKAVRIAKKVFKAFGSPGILAVEMFVGKDGSIWVNESAPRPHNSAHHTIEACTISQFEMLLRILLDFPLIQPDLIKPAVMVNLVGTEGYTGPAVYQGLNEILGLNETYIHLYGKKMTKPFRKMGHVTIMDSVLEQAVIKGNFVLSTLKIIS